VPFRTGIDGGTNPVFLAKLSTRTEDGRVYQLSATGMEAPGALPRTPSVAPAPLKVAAAPTEAADSKELGSVPVPTPAPQPKAPPVQKEASLTGFIDNLFSKPAEAKPAVDKLVTRSAESKRKPAAPVHVAAPVAPPAPQPKLAKNPEPKAPAPEPKKEEPPQLRTAYSAAPQPSGAVLPGAQPVLSAGSFTSFR
jgi:hypothetical protein